MNTVQKCLEHFRVRHGMWRSLFRCPVPRCNRRLPITMCNKASEHMRDEHDGEWPGRPYYRITPARFEGQRKYDGYYFYFDRKVFVSEMDRPIATMGQWFARAHLLGFLMDRIMEVELYGTTTINIGELLVPEEMITVLAERFNTPVAEWSLRRYGNPGGPRLDSNIRPRHPEPDSSDVPDGYGTLETIVARARRRWAKPTRAPSPRQDLEPSTTTHRSSRPSSDGSAKKGKGKGKGKKSDSKPRGSVSSASGASDGSRRRSESYSSTLSQTTTDSPSSGAKSKSRPSAAEHQRRKRLRQALRASAQEEVDDDESATESEQPLSTRRTPRMGVDERPDDPTFDDMYFAEHGERTPRGTTPARSETTMEVDAPGSDDRMVRRRSRSMTSRRSDSQSRSASQGRSLVVEVNRTSTPGASGSEAATPWGDWRTHMNLMCTGVAQLQRAYTTLQGQLEEERQERRRQGDQAAHRATELEAERGTVRELRQQLHAEVVAKEAALAQAKAAERAPAPAAGSDASSKDAEIARLRAQVQAAARDTPSTSAPARSYLTSSDRTLLEREMRRWLVALGAETSRHQITRERLFQANVGQAIYRRRAMKCSCVKKADRKLAAAGMAWEGSTDAAVEPTADGLDRGLNRQQLLRNMERPQPPNSVRDETELQRVAADTDSSVWPMLVSMGATAEHSAEAARQAVERVVPVQAPSTDEEAMDDTEDSD